MKFCLLLLTIIINFSFVHAQDVYEERQERTEWFRDARFGMFIHWGIYAIPARGEWVRYVERIPAKGYEKLAQKFNPKKYNPEEWAKLFKYAGADFAGSDEYIEKIQGGWLEFDKTIATPDMMGTVSKLGRVLGPRGMMPNAKLGTVTFDVGKAVSETKAGKTDFKVEKAGIVHAPVGKASFGKEKLLRNQAPDFSLADMRRSGSLVSTGPGETGFRFSQPHGR